MGRDEGRRSGNHNPCLSVFIRGWFCGFRCPKSEFGLRRPYLRDFAFICGEFSAFGGLRRVKTVKKPRKMARNGLRRAKNGDYDRKWPQMAANGGREQSGKGILAGKQEMGTKTGGERAFIVFSCSAAGSVDRAAAWRGRRGGQAVVFAILVAIFGEKAEKRRHFCGRRAESCWNSYNPV